MPQECYKVSTSDFDWKKGRAKKTLKEFEKAIYHSNGDYETAYSQVQKRMLTGNHEFERQLDRSMQSSGHWSHYIHDQAGFRDSAHLDAPEEDIITKKFKKLGHIRSEKLVGWDLVKPRDNKMYYIGEHSSLRDQDRLERKKKGYIFFK
jgi:hypothetical protein